LSRFVEITGKVAPSGTLDAWAVSNLGDAFGECVVCVYMDREVCMVCVGVCGCV
jgi:hypothetical protein